ncbi:MAG: hypothetical protein LBU69_00650, partial [Deltaproteobacteria bacterium]|nr:hypothetical protein [Deltaproteobacteria bacterium]
MASLLSPALSRTGPGVFLGAIMIVSLTHGRIRARLTHLRGQQAPDIPAESIKGVRNITINPRTGSVLLEYDPEAISLEKLASFLEPFDPEGAATLRHPELLKPRSIFAQPVEVPLELIKEEDRPRVSDNRKKFRPRGSAEATSEAINLTIGFLGVAFSAFAGSIRTHALAGAAFGIMLAQHLWKHRHRLRPIQQMSWAEILGIDIPPFLRPKTLATLAPEYVPPANGPQDPESPHLESPPNRPQDPPSPHHETP